MEISADKSINGRVQNSNGTEYELTICNGYGCKGGAGVRSRTKFILKGIIIFPINRSLKQVNKRSTRCPETDLKIILYRDIDWRG